LRIVFGTVFPLHIIFTVLDKEFLMANEYWKYGLAAGVGIVVGVIGVALLSRGGFDLKKAAASILSHGMDLKEKAAAVADTARENIEDIAAEARYEQGQRKTAARG
jgi:hypothetical protein